MDDKKYLIVTFSDGKKFRIKAGAVATHRATYYAIKDLENIKDKLFPEEYNSEYDRIKTKEYNCAMMDEYELIDWAQNNMDWSMLVPFAEEEESKIINYDEEWCNAEMEVKYLEQ